MFPSDDSIIQAFPPAPTGVRVRDISVRLNLARGDRGTLRDALERLVREGRVMRLGARRYALSSGDNLAIGTLTMTRRGFGFVAKGERAR